jgi:hypothetical protein
MQHGDSIAWPVGSCKFVCASPGGGLLLASFALSEPCLSDGMPISQVLATWLSQHAVGPAVDVRDVSLCLLPSW